MTGFGWKSEHCAGLLLALLLAVEAPAQMPKTLGTRPPRDSAATVVLYNNRDPVSKDLASYYAERRRIPPEQVVALSSPVAEEITREEYRSTIERPLRRMFEQRGWWEMREAPDGKKQVVSSKIRYLAVMRGMPLKIRTTILPPAPDKPPPDPPNKGDPVRSRDEASVDSELAALGALVEDPFGVINNPYFRRFTPVLDTSGMPWLLLVGRLDAPSPEIVRRMIDDALWVEQNGLWGWAYVDRRSIAEQGYRDGDEWLRQAATDCWNGGVPVVLDEMPEIFPAGFPVRRAALYYGWYADRLSGAMSDAGLDLVRGAVAAHIHSFSASTLRDPSIMWTGPLLARGAAASLGNVYEPYLALTTHLDVFNERLLKGFTLAEAASMGQPVLSWMSVVAGDPLYRPYAAPLNVLWKPPASGPVAPWVTLRRELIQAGRMGVAQPLYLQRYARGVRTGLAYEALGLLQSFMGEPREAMESLETAGKLYQDREDRFRTVIERVRIQQMLANKVAALATVDAALKQPWPPPAEKLLRVLRDQISPPPPPPQITPGGAGKKK